MNEPVYPAIIRLAKALQLAMGWRVTVKGAENLPESGPAVLAINHAGYLDFIFSAWACVFEKKRWVRFLAKKEVFDHKIAGPLMRGMKHIPVDRKKDPARALDLAIEALRRGEVVGTFPEATINPSFVPSRGKTGTVRMSQASGAPVLPVAVWGAHRILTKGHSRNFQRGVAILINIGKPMTFAPGEDPRVGTERLMEAIRTLLEEAQKEYPQQPAGKSDLWWLPAHLGGTAPTPEEAEEQLAAMYARRASSRPSSPATAELADQIPTADAGSELDQPESPDSLE
ncbi:MAG TPA: lysophospholipid acyltransferase family protein [Actinomycetota bacterium]|nr:lysophospholipid acyltransferase family protein [Actinomycetota bacterium]